MDLRILYLGDLVGMPGLKLLQDRLGEVRDELKPHLVVMNVENAANGSGITKTLGRKVREAGVDLMTLGDHAYGKRDSIPYIEKEERILRPANYPKEAQGRDLLLHELECGATVAVFQVQGRVFIQAATDCPFRAADRLMQRARARTKVVLVEVHAEATSEKIAMGFHLAGRASAVLGSHTHVQTADEQILPGGTAYLTDLGMSGPYDSVIGRDKRKVLQKFRTNVPAFFNVAEGGVRLSGAFLTVDSETGKATSIRRFHLGPETEVSAALGAERSHDLPAG